MNVNINIYHHWNPENAAIEKKLDSILKLLRRDIMIGQDILEAVTAQTTTVDSFIELVKGLVDEQVIPPAIGSEILAKLADSKTKVELEAAVLANLHPVEPPPVP